MSTGHKERRRDWTAIVAHDLRQPTFAIGVFARLLANRIGDCPELAHIDTACRRLERQIEDLLDAAAIERNQLTVTLEEVELRELVRSCLERLCTTRPDLRVSVRSSIDRAIARVDPARIEQVLENLILNAYKYGDRSATIGVTIEPRGDELELSVTNRGPGIARAELPFVFQRFRRGSAARAAGTGLGLYIVQGLIRAHGGRVTVESTPGESTTFRFTVSAARRDDDLAYSRCG